MSEQPLTLPNQQFKDEAVVRLLENPEVQDGVARADASISAYYDQLKETGNTVHPLFEGVTPTGTRFVVAEYTDMPTPDQQDGKYVHGSYPSFSDGKFSIFAYPIKEVTKPGFAESLAPSSFSDVTVYRGDGIDVLLEPTFETEEIAHKVGGVALDENARRILHIQASERRFKHTLHIPQVSSDYPSYGGQRINSLEDAAFGMRRWEAVMQEVAPLMEKRKQHLVEASHTDPEVRAREQAAAAELAERAQTTVHFLRDNPSAVDQPGLIHDKAKAEYVAHEVKGSMDKLATAREGTRAKYIANAEQRAEAAVVEYDEDPLGVFDMSVQTKTRSPFGRFRRK